MRGMLCLRHGDGDACFDVTFAFTASGGMFLCGEVTLAITNTDPA